MDKKRHKKHMDDSGELHSKFKKIRVNEKYHEEVIIDDINDVHDSKLTAELLFLIKTSNK